MLLMDTLPVLATWEKYHLFMEDTMLVLSRQRDESIIIGDEIEIKVVDIRGDKVRLGITAPKEISVHRKEVYDAIRRQGRKVTQVIKPEVSDKPSEPPKSD